MAVNLGSSALAAAYVGGNAVSKMYVGSTEVYSAGGGGPTVPGAPTITYTGFTDTRWHSTTTWGSQHSGGNLIYHYSLTAPPSDGGSAITGYRLYYDGNSGSSAPYQSLASSTTTFDVYDSQYANMNVRAVNAIGASGPSNVLYSGPPVSRIYQREYITATGGRNWGLRPWPTTDQVGLPTTVSIYSGHYLSPTLVSGPIDLFGVDGYIGDVYSYFVANADVTPYHLRYSNTYGEQVSSFADTQQFNMQYPTGAPTISFTKNGTTPVYTITLSGSHTNGDAGFGGYWQMIVNGLGFGHLDRNTLTGDLPSSWTGKSIYVYLFNAGGLAGPHSNTVTIP